MHLKEGALLQGGKYCIESVLGQGGFGITYKAYQKSLKRRVAIKEFFMKEHCNRDSETSHVSVPSVGSRDLVARFRTKFIKEAQTIAMMDHHHIIKVFDVFEENGTAYYVMEYLECGSLADCMPLTGMSEPMALKYIHQVADALRYIHEEKHTTHLDVKPSNILLKSNGDAVLIDFGIAIHYDDGTDGVTSTYLIGISKGYAPLEQNNDGGLLTFSPETDIYSLGATLYKLLTGETPPEASAVNENGLPELPQSVSGSVRAAIYAAMQPRRKDRPKSVSEFMNILGRVSGKLPPSPPPPSQPSLSGPVPPRRKKRGYLWLALAFVLACVGVGLLIFPTENDNTEEAVPVVAEYDYDVIGPYDFHKGVRYVDLGLSSGLKWAVCNFGASDPEECGAYFMWGARSVLTDDCMTYGVEMDDISDDARYDVLAYELGGGWRMPTVAEVDELTEECEWNWGRMYGNYGYLVTGPNGRSIFFPCCEGEDGFETDPEEAVGAIWSSTPGDDNTKSYALFFYNDGGGIDVFERNDVANLRPVLD